MERSSKRQVRATYLGALRDRAPFCASAAVSRALEIGFPAITVEDPFERDADELLADAASDATSVFNVRVCKVTI